ncbi:MAG: DUF4876 domain-containing protein [Candidatus Krumholzibacteria bacterium]|nr:DUF4876 domain-containing protein [Candidatus Krumholzibacteria bacterium]
MKRIVLAAACISMGVALASCGLDKPQHPDGDNVLTLLALDTSGVYGSEWRGVPGAQVEISSTSFKYERVFETDADGSLVLNDLPAGNYMIQASEDSAVLLMGQTQEHLKSATEKKDTIYMSFASLSPVVINEIYYTGCNSSSFYFYDQFVELYNTTNDTIYLDGYFMIRGTQVAGEDFLDFDWETADFALGYYVYRFPGTRGVTRLCPIGPKKYLVIAQDAINHSKSGSLCLNLLGADWEFFNQMSSDFDNLSVPNLTQVSTSNNDFTMSLGHCAIWLSTGEEYLFKEHCYVNSSGGTTCSTYIEIPYSTIIDAVEYASSLDARRYMSTTLDAGLAGVEVIKYSGQSVERKIPGLDSNNSTFDFEVNNSPTPGYSH